MRLDPGAELFGDPARLAPEFEAAGTTVIGLSKDSVKAHDKFCRKHGLGIILASDEGGTTCEDPPGIREGGGVKLYIATNWDMVLDRNNFPGWYRLLDYVGIDYYPDNSNVSPSRMWLAAKQLNAAFPSLNGVLFSESGAYHEGGQPQQSYFAQMARGVMAGRNYNWFKGIWWYNKHVANDGDPSIAPDADESTVTAATMRFLCKTQTMLSDARCRAIIVPRK